MTTPQSSAEKRPSGPGPVTVARLAADLAGGTTIQDVIEQAHAMEHARPMPCRVVYLDYRGPRGDRKLSGEAADLIWSALRLGNTDQRARCQDPFCETSGYAHSQGPTCRVRDIVLTGYAADEIRQWVRQQVAAQQSQRLHCTPGDCTGCCGCSVVCTTHPCGERDPFRASGRSAVLSPDASGHVLGRDHGRPPTPPAAGEPLLATGLDVRWRCLTTEPHAPHRGSVELEVDGTEHRTQYRCEGVRGLPLGMQPLTETPLLTDLASLLIRQDMELAGEGLRAGYEQIRDYSIMEWAVKRAGHLFSHHDLWDYDLVTDEDHFPRCVSHRHLNRTLKDLIPDG